MKWKILFLALVLMVPMALAQPAQAITIELTTSGGASTTLTTASDAAFFTNVTVGTFSLGAVSITQFLQQFPNDNAVYTLQLGGSGWKTSDPSQTITVTAYSTTPATLGWELHSGVLDLQGTTTQALGVTGSGIVIIDTTGTTIGSSTTYPGSATYTGNSDYDALGFTTTFQLGSTIGTFAPSLSLTTEVPEPGTLLLLGLGLAGIGLARFSRRMR